MSGSAGPGVRLNNPLNYFSRSLGCNTNSELVLSILIATKITAWQVIFCFVADPLFRDPTWLLRTSYNCSSFYTKEKLGHICFIFFHSCCNLCSSMYLNQHLVVERIVNNESDSLWAWLCIVLEFYLRSTYSTINLSYYLEMLFPTKFIFVFQNLGIWK